MNAAMTVLIASGELCLTLSPVFCHFTFQQRQPLVFFAVITFVSAMFTT